MMSAKFKKQSVYPVILILLISVLPLLLAYVFYNHRSFVPQKTSNHGVLVQPVVRLDNIVDMRAVNPHKKWLLISFLTEASCSEACLALLEKQSYTMQQVHIAMNRNTNRVQRHLFVVEGVSPEILQKQSISHPFMTFSFTNIVAWQELLHGSNLTDQLADYIFIVDPDNYLVLAYHYQKHTGKDLIRDLTKLLRASQKG